MRSKKKILSVLLAAAMVLLLVPGDTFMARAASDPTHYIFDISEGSITVAAGTIADTVNVKYGASQTKTADFVATQAITITGDAQTASTITVAGAIAVNITLSKVNIDVSGITGSCAFSIGSGSTVNLTLTDDNILKSGVAYAGLY
jgi:5-enolpyruvylshikimate-3-phosphate synthase